MTKQKLISDSIFMTQISIVLMKVNHNKMNEDLEMKNGAKNSYIIFPHFYNVMEFNTFY